MSGFFAALTGGTSIAILDTQTVTRGQTSSGTDPILFYSGFRTTGPLGSITDSTSNVYSGATITDLYFYEASTNPPIGIYTRQIVWRLSSVVSNSGWSQMEIGGVGFLRADASFTTGTGFSQWVWSLNIPDQYVTEGDPFTASTTVKWY